MRILCYLLIFQISLSLQERHTEFNFFKNQAESKHAYTRVNCVCMLINLPPTRSPLLQFFPLKFLQIIFSNEIDRTVSFAFEYSMVIEKYYKLKKK